MAKDAATERHLLVDYENVQQINLAALPEDFRVTVFAGSNQNSVPFELVRSAQKLGTRLAWFKVEGVGNNALDFHIAYTLGRLLTLNPQLDIAILSKDAGYDPLVRYLAKSGRKVRRIVSIAEIPVPEPAVGAIAMPPIPGAPSPGATTTPQPAATPAAKPARSPAATPSTAHSDERYTRVLELLGKTPKNARPRKRSTLSQHISSMFQKKLSEQELERLLKKLFAHGKITESNDMLSYRF